MKRRLCARSQIFCTLDTNANFELSRAEFERAMLGKCGFTGSVGVLRTVFDSMNTDGSGTIDFGEWTSWLEGRRRTDITRQLKTEASRIADGGSTADDANGGDGQERWDGEKRAERPHTAQMHSARTATLHIWVHAHVHSSHLGCCCACAHMCVLRVHSVCAVCALCVHCVCAVCALCVRRVAHR